VIADSRHLDHSGMLVRESDAAVLSVVDAELGRQQDQIELIALENIVSSAG
jgi:glycine/serine hydroxymethyltransferase